MSELAGKRVLLTRPRLQAGELASALLRLGAIPVFFPVIEIAPPADPAPLDQALLRLDSYDWLILTSVNGVQAVWTRLAAISFPSLPRSIRVAAIGPKTASALRERGVEPDFVPHEYIAEAILPGLGELHGRRFLLPRADQARPDLAESIRASGGMAHEIVAYRTLPAQPDPDDMEAIRQGVDVVTFTSSSTVRNFSRIARASGLDPLQLPGDPLFACIGPVTAATARQQGYPVSIMASQYTAEGLLHALVESAYRM